MSPAAPPGSPPERPSPPGGRRFESEALTHGVRVGVRTRYLSEQSDPRGSLWAFAYQITIRNEGDAPVQLLNRRWRITNAHGKVEEVRGPGVVGEQPRIAPGESYVYTSGCPLDTPYGSMEGAYGMVRDGGEEFEAEVAPFLLAVPGDVN
jgi:ApaG protein